MLPLMFVQLKEIQDHCWNILFISPLKGLCSCLTGFLIFRNLSYLLLLLTLCVWDTLLLLRSFPWSGIQICSILFLHWDNFVQICSISLPVSLELSSAPCNLSGSIFKSCWSLDTI